MRRSINWSVFGIFGVIIVGFIIAGFLVSPDARTDDGSLPLNIFFFIMAGMFLLTNSAVILWAHLSNRRRERIERTWLDAEALIKDANETGTYINNQPQVRFLLQVDSPMRSGYEVKHKAVIPLTAIMRYQVGNRIPVKVNPEDPGDLMII